MRDGADSERGLAGVSTLPLRVGVIGPPPTISWWHCTVHRAVLKSSSEGRRSR